MHAFLAERWTASLLAWSMIFPAVLDRASGQCVCGALGTGLLLDAVRLKVPIEQKSLIHGDARSVQPSIFEKSAMRSMVARTL